MLSAVPMLHPVLYVCLLYLNTFASFVCQLNGICWAAGEQMKSLKRYQLESPSDCALNDDGTGFNDHVLNEEEWELVPQMVR